jgi:hypothetical protein
MIHSVYIERIVYVHSTFQEIEKFEEIEVRLFIERNQVVSKFHEGGHV